MQYPRRRSTSRSGLYSHETPSADASPATAELVRLLLGPDAPWLVIDRYAPNAINTRRPPSTRRLTRRGRWRQLRLRHGRAVRGDGIDRIDRLVCVAVARGDALVRRRSVACSGVRFRRGGRRQDGGDPAFPRFAAVASAPVTVDGWAVACFAPEARGVRAHLVTSAQARAGALSAESHGRRLDRAVWRVHPDTGRSGHA